MEFNSNNSHLRRFESGPERTSTRFLFNIPLHDNNGFQ